MKLLLLLLVSGVFFTLTLNLYGQNGAWTIIDSAAGFGAFLHNDIDCASEDDCVYVADSLGNLLSVVCRTTDAGKTWQTILSDSFDVADPRPIRRFLRVAHPTPEQCIVLADSNYVFNTFDGGKTWDTIHYVFEVGRLSRLEFSDSNHGYVLGPPVWLQFSPNGGQSWVGTTMIHSLDSFSYYSLAVAPKRVVVALLKSKSYSRVAHSVDNGFSWRVYDAPQFYTDIDFSDAAHGWMTGGVPTGTADNELDIIALTSDSGRSWREVMHQWNDPAFGLRSVSFADSLNGVVVGYGGKIFRTVDGGETWIRQYFNCDTLTATCGLGEVCMVSPYRAYATVGGYGRLIRYTEDPAGIKAEDQHSVPFRVTVYPQPVTSDESITVGIQTERSGEFLLELFSLKGELIQSETLNVTSERHDVNVHIPLISGSYILRVSRGERFATRRIVVQN